MHKISPKASLFENACVKQINLVEEYDNMNFNGWQLIFKDFCLVGLPRQRESGILGEREEKKGGGGVVVHSHAKFLLDQELCMTLPAKYEGERCFFFFLKTFIHVLFGMLFLFIGGIQRFSVWSQFDSPICFSSMSDFLLARNVFFLGVFSYINYVKLLTWTNYISKNLGTQVFNNSFHNCWLQKFGIKASCCWGGMLWLPDWCIIKWSMLGLSGKWCYSYHNLFL